MGSYDKVVQLLLEKYGVDREKVSPEANMADLGPDSLSVAELLLAIEPEFGIEVSTEVSTEEASLTTQAGAVAVVDRFIEAKKG